MQGIECISSNEFRLVTSLHDMRLIKEGDRWAMYTENAAVRAWRNGWVIPKYFESLEEVEAKYKSWRGIAALVEEDLTKDDSRPAISGNFSMEP